MATTTSGATTTTTTVRDALVWRRAVYVSAAMMSAAAIYACWSGTALIWDGAYQFDLTLINQWPYQYLTRFHTLVLWMPLVQVSRVTDNLTVLQTVFGLPFALAPVIGLLLSWWVVRRHAPQLILWAAFGIAAAPLPGQVFIINDSLFQQHLFWPVFLGVFVPLTRGQKATLAALVVFQFSHQVGLLLLGGAAASGAVMAAFDRINRRRHLLRTLILAALTAAALAKVLVVSDPTSSMYDSYAASESTWEIARMRWNQGVAGWPIRGLTFMWASGVLAAVAARKRGAGASRALTTASAASVACALAGGALWVVWGSNVGAWGSAIDYRRWLVPLTAPFFALGLLDACRLASARNPRRSGAAAAEPSSTGLPRALCPILAAFFSIVLTMQSAQWGALTRRLVDDVSARPEPVVLRARLSWLDGTSLGHWSTDAYVLALQGRIPSKLLTDERGAALLRGDVYPAVPLCSFHTLPVAPGPAGWFDCRPVAKAFRAWDPSRSQAPPAHQPRRTAQPPAPPPRAVEIPPSSVAQ